MPHPPRRLVALAVVAGLVGALPACLPSGEQGGFPTPGGAGGGGGRGGSGGTGGGSGGTGGNGGAGQHPGTGGHAHGSGDAADAGAPEPEDPDMADSSDMAKPLTDPTMLAIAGELQGAFLQLDCASDEIELQYCLPKDRGMQQVKVKFGGEPGRMYAVTLRVWGVVEAIKYTGGRKAGPHFYVGGRSGTAGTAEYGLVAGPQTFFLNHFELGEGDHYTYGVSYETEPVPIPGAAELTLYVRDPDNFINTNHMDSLPAHPSPGLAPKLAAIRSQPLQGQFVYLEVAGVRPLP